MVKLSDDVRPYQSKIGPGVAYVVDPSTRTLTTSTYMEHVAAFRPGAPTAP